MQASAWTNGQNTYGISVGKPNRKRYFDPAWEQIEVEIEGRFYIFGLTDGFWKSCPEFRDKGQPVIRQWLQRSKSLEWPYRDPPKVELVPLGGNKFRLLP